MVAQSLSQCEAPVAVDSPPKQQLLNSFSRRRSRVRGAVPTNMVEINGHATICFDEDGRWFQGSIVGKEETQFAMYGTKSRRNLESNEESCNCSKETMLEDAGAPGVPVTFDIRVVDCEIGEEYSLKRVHGRNGEICSFTCGSVSFTTEKVFRGSGADMVAKKCFGKKMEGSNCCVYTGPIQIVCAPTRTPVPWCL